MYVSFTFVHALCKVRAYAALSSLRDEICCVGVCGEGKKTHTHQYVGGFFSLAAVLFAFFTSVTPPPTPLPLFPISLGWIRAAMKDLRHVCAGDTLVARARHLPSSNQRCFYFFVFFSNRIHNLPFFFPPSYLLASAAVCLRMWREGARRVSHSTSGLSCIQMPGK